VLVALSSVKSYATSNAIPGRWAGGDGNTPRYSVLDFTRGHVNTARPSSLGFIGGADGHVPALEVIAATRYELDGATNGVVNALAAAKDDGPGVVYISPDVISGAMGCPSHNFALAALPSVTGLASSCRKRHRATLGSGGQGVAGGKRHISPVRSAVGRPPGTEGNATGLTISMITLDVASLDGN